VNETRGGRIADEAEALFSPDKPVDPERPEVETR